MKLMVEEKEENAEKNVSGGKKGKRTVANALASRQGSRN